MAVEDGEAGQAIGSRKRKTAQIELRGEPVASKEQCAGTFSAAEEATGKLGGAGRAVEKKKKTVAKEKGKREGTFSTAEEAAGKLGGAGKKMSARRPEARTEFLGVSRIRTGKYGAQIKRSKGLPRWLGTFDTAEEAAKAYDAAAVELHGATVVTNFKQSGESSGVKMKVKKPAAPRPDVWTEFRGVYRQPSGRYNAQLWDSKGKSTLSLGTFGTAVEAARAYDAATVELYGASAVTNFMASDEQSGQAAESVKMKIKKRAAARPDTLTGFRGVYRQLSGKYTARIWDQKMKSTVSLGSFGTAEEAARAFDAAAVELRGARAITNFGPGRTVRVVPRTQHDDISAAEWQQVEELLKDMDSIDEKEALIDAAAILHQIALARHGDGGRD